MSGPTLTRRQAGAFLFRVSLGACVCAVTSPSRARDGGGGSSGGSGSGGGGSSGGSGSGSGGSGSGGSGSGSSGTGSSGSSGSGSSGTGSDHDGDSSGGPGSGPGAQSPTRSVSDEDRARQAVSGGQAVPLAQILPTVRAAVPGDILDVRFGRQQGGALVYDVTVLSASGQFRQVVVDAQRNRVIETRRR